MRDKLEAAALRRLIYRVIRDHQMSNMVDEDGYPFPLVDLMSNPAPADISTGEEQMLELTDEIVAAILSTKENRHG